MSSEDLASSNPNFFVLGTPKRNSKQLINNNIENPKIMKSHSDLCDIVLESSPILPPQDLKDSDISDITFKSNSQDGKNRLLSFRENLQIFKSNSNPSTELQTTSSSQNERKRKLIRGLSRPSTENSSESDSEKNAIKDHEKKQKIENINSSNLTKAKIHPPKRQTKINIPSSVTKNGNFLQKSKVLNVDSDSEGDGDSYLEKASLIDAEEIALKFFNKSKKDQLMAQTGVTEAEAELIIQSRPFRNYELMELTFRKTKGLRVSIVNQYHDTVIGLAEIDQVINKCFSVSKNLNDSLLDFGLEYSEEKGKVSKVDNSLIQQQSININPEYSLKSYQLEGVSWLQCLFNSKASGILADEMGLGKTFQVIAFLTNLKDNNVPGPHLVICPTSTLDNWLREFAKFSPKLKVKCYYGNQDERRRMAYKIEKKGAYFDVLVSTYNVAISNKTDRAMIKRVQFKAPFRLLLTGTPLQNNLIELISLLSFILPKVFDEFAGSLQMAFKAKKSAPKKATLNHPESESQNNDETPETTVPDSLSPIEHQHIKKAQKLLAPFVLRRRKAEVLKDLPKKVEHLVKVTMSDRQLSLYTEILEHHNKMIEQSILDKQKPTSPPSLLESIIIEDDDENTSKPSLLGHKHIHPEDNDNENNDFNFSKSFIGRATDLRKVCNHPLLVRRFYTDSNLKEMANLLLKEQDYSDANYDYVYEDMKCCSDFELNYYCEKYRRLSKFVLPSELLFDSAKVTEIKRVLDESMQAGEKVLVFSQFTTVLDILEKIFKKWNIQYCRLDGNTKANERQEMIEVFNDGNKINVFLLSTKAGGFGINLASANVVVIHDIDVNPHNDKQAEDRAHRVGQTKTVRVIKLVAKDSVEEDILKLANAKLMLDDNITNAHLLEVKK
ncbi:ATP-dependent helicase fft3 [Smittium culicis]|uniref:ATP-dependent helicase fft3 n=1 Tax=Smittium culicis TaxID=133412 RepID=A0A1R1XKS4_9FUNG|nr:ATP-dependent helicase fft3 [Smittium culicis]